jgi:hypothetical protein
VLFNLAQVPELSCDGGQGKRISPAEGPHVSRPQNC